MTRRAIVMVNLGGPNSLEAVEPFLRELFRDPAIIRLPVFLREPLAWWIAKRRRSKSQAIFKAIGGYSPLLENTQAQAQALEHHLGDEFRVFIAMRYWHPFTAETLKEVIDYKPDQVILLPLYPQFSTTTTASSLLCWTHEAQKMNFNCPTSTVGCYYTHEKFIDAVVDLIKKSSKDIQDLSSYHLLFTAHGLPERIVQQGDPYQRQVEATVEAVYHKLNSSMPYTISYQSRVGPLKWIGPSCEQEIQRLGQESKNIFLIPIAFVSEHSETLYELDIQYKALAQESGVSAFIRVPTVETHPLFIECLADLVKSALQKEIFYCSTQCLPCWCQNLKKVS
ncbi:MAG: ferrochelatase [Janthinobacterium lividum]